MPKPLIQRNRQKITVTLSKTCLDQIRDLMLLYHYSLRNDVIERAIGDYYARARRAQPEGRFKKAAG